jgi:hypothetical protein
VGAKRFVKKEEETSGRFTGHGWRFDVHIDFLSLAATAGKLAAEEEEGRGGNDDHKDHQYGHDCCATATTIIITHEIDPPFNSGFAFRWRCDRVRRAFD